MKQATLYLGIIGALATLGYVLYLWLSWPYVVLVQSGSRSERQYRKQLEQEGIAYYWDSAIMITEVHVRRLWAERAVRIAREIDPSGDKIVVTYPDYARTETGGMKTPHDHEKP